LEFGPALPNAAQCENHRSRPSNSMLGLRPTTPRDYRE
jgi:hypothetical protein